MFVKHPNKKVTMTFFPQGGGASTSKNMMFTYIYIFSPKFFTVAKI